ncbi:MAG: ABC transporter ATP-binding protein [Sedimentisphaerales bacterium]|nr:ABC transporter ATP-binding protein [Sedimentisphaerales bacterium]
MNADNALIILENIAKSYSSPEGEPAHVLNGINLRVAPGETVAIVGPSGSGKSTLLNIIGSLDTPDSGKVIFDSQDLSQLSPDSLAKFRNQKIGFIFQMHHLLNSCTVLENVLIPTLAQPDNEDSNESQNRALELLKRVGLDHRISYRPGQLSGGERQRVALVRALINQPQLILADEPTGSLDRNASEKMAELLVELNQQHNVALIVVTHTMTLAQKMQRTLQLTDGTLQTLELNKN